MSGDRMREPEDINTAAATHGVASVFAYYDLVAMRFGDGSWAFGSSVGHEFDWDGSICPSNGFALVRAGIITEEEKEAKDREEQERFDRRDRAEYERLKAKFGEEF